MRHSWWLLLLRKAHFRSSLQAPSLSSFHYHSKVTSSSPFTITSSALTANPLNPKFACNFSSEPLVQQPTKDTTDNHLIVSDILSKITDFNDIAKELELNGVVVTHELVLKVLNSLESSPDAARRFFDWVLERDADRLSSKAYNLMLGILGVNGFVEEFWALVEAMKKKGYGVSRGTRDKVTEKFENEGLRNDLERLKGVFTTGSLDNSVEKIGMRVSRIIRNQVWGDDVEGLIRDLNVTFTSDLVKVVLEDLALEPKKALIYFRWLEESELFKHDEVSYNAMAWVLGREDCIDRFWKVVGDMRSSGYQMEVETFNIVLERFVKRKMIKEAVSLYEFAMGGANKPSVQCFTFLLRKIIAGKEMDVALLSKVLRVFTSNGYPLTDSMLNAVLKSLTSVGRFEECNKILKEMKESGFVAGSQMQSKIAFLLSRNGKKDEVSEFVDHMEASGNNLDHKAWTSLIKGYCVSGALQKATDCFQQMVEKEGVSHAGYAFDLLVNAHCCRNKATKAFELLQDYVNTNQLRPFRATYQVLIRNLVFHGSFNDALSLLSLMKNQGFPPYVEPFIAYISKSGTGADAVALMKSMTSRKFPSTSVVIRLFEAFFKAGRHNEAQDFLSGCPSYIRSHADVLNLFCSNKSSEDADAAIATVAI